MPIQARGKKIAEMVQEVEIATPNQIALSTVSSITVVLLEKQHACFETRLCRLNAMPIRAAMPATLLLCLM